MPECRNAPRAERLLRGVLDELGLRDIPVTMRVIADNAEAQRVGFIGSPTFLIDGCDIFPHPGAPASLSCRLYQTGSGALAGLPGRDQLAGAVRHAQLAGDQLRQWEDTYQAHPRMYGERPSAAAVYAAGLFRRRRLRDVLELGAGHGRDAMYFAAEGFTVQATDVSAAALEQLRVAADARGVRVCTIHHDIRDPLPLPDRSVDAVYAHILLCMALSTSEIHAAISEIRRVLRPNGVLVYTVRHTGDAHYRAGVAHGDNIFAHGGFAVHFFDRRLVDELATGWSLDDVAPFEEGELPRRLWRVTQTLDAAG